MMPKETKANISKLLDEQIKYLEGASHLKEGTLTLSDYVERMSALVLLRGLLDENEGLRLLLDWATECDFGFDNIPEEYERYKDEIQGMSYKEGLIHIAMREVARKRDSEEC